MNSGAMISQNLSTKIGTPKIFIQVREVFRIHCIFLQIYLFPKTYETDLLEEKHLIKTENKN